MNHHFARGVPYGLQGREKAHGLGITQRAAKPQELGSRQASQRLSQALESHQESKAAVAEEWDLWQRLLRLRAHTCSALGEMMGSYNYCTLHARSLITRKLLLAQHTPEKRKTKRPMTRLLQVSFDKVSVARFGAKLHQGETTRH